MSQACKRKCRTYLKYISSLTRTECFSYYYSLIVVILQCTMYNFYCHTSKWRENRRNHLFFLGKSNLYFNWKMKNENNKICWFFNLKLMLKCYRFRINNTTKFTYTFFLIHPLTPMINVWDAWVNFNKIYFLKLYVHMCSTS